ncbi:MAG TPA: hypothetical protein PLC79_10950, partial [Phycisphaerae bacterium]|nr:hypothetical protein [Phycisphaerae bacterium]
MRRTVFGSRVSFLFGPEAARKGPAAREGRAADGNGPRTRMRRQGSHARARDAEAPRPETARGVGPSRMLRLAGLGVLLGLAAPGIAGEGPTKFCVAPDGRLLKDG